MQFVEQDYPKVVRFLMLAGASPYDAQDAAQEALLQGWCEVASGRWGALRNPPGWIRRVAWNVHRRPPGQQRLQPFLELGLEQPDLAYPGPGHAELTEQTQTVLSALAALPDMQRVVMALTVDGATSTEIAQLLGLSPQQVLDLRKQARKSLRRNLALVGGRKEGAR
ncbi:RNA polymerase sigma factor [Streptomyces mirabilis]